MFEGTSRASIRLCEKRWQRKGFQVNGLGAERAASIALEYAESIDQLNLGGPECLEVPLHRFRIRTTVGLLRSSAKPCTAGRGV